MSNCSDLGSGGSEDASFPQNIQPNPVLCIGLSAIGGLLEVSSTMCLAYPEHKTKLGKVYTKRQQQLHMTINLLLMGIASVLYIGGSWFGPVSLSVPTVMVSKLLFNLIIIGVVLKMDSFSKNQRVGTYCIACAILTLPEIGPREQDCTDACPEDDCPDVLRMLQEPPAIVWTVVLFAASIFCCVMMVVLKRRTDRGNTPSQNLSLVVYVTAQVTSAVVGTSVSKMFALVDPPLLYVLFVLAIVFAAINVISLILAAVAVDQGVFVPMQTCATLVTNLITGLIVWEEYKSVELWISYITVHLIMMLGIWLLSPEDAIANYKVAKQFHPDKLRGEDPEADAKAHSAIAQQAQPDDSDKIELTMYKDDEAAWRATTRISTSRMSHRSRNPSIGSTMHHPPPAPPPPNDARDSGTRDSIRGRTRTVSFQGMRMRTLSHLGPAVSEQEKDAWASTFSFGQTRRASVSVDHHHQSRRESASACQAACVSPSSSTADTCSASFAMMQSPRAGAPCTAPCASLTALKEESRASMHSLSPQSTRMNENQPQV